ncbi:MAG: hypothetical protein WCA30_05110 [Dermatophilaceae bacterium]
MSSPLRRIAAAALAIPLAVGMATSADAKSTFQAKSSGNYAIVYWDEQEDLGDSVRYTYGGIDAFGDRNVELYGYLEVITCLKEFPDETDPCTYEYSYVYADPGAVTLDLGKKNTGASLSGPVVLEGELGDSETVQLDISLVGTGATIKSRNSFTYRDPDGVRYSVRSSQTGREADASGSIGDIVLSASASGEFGTYRQMEREMIP